MRQVSGFRFRVSGAAALRSLVVLLLVLACCAPAFADSKSENLKPLDDTGTEGIAGTTNAPAANEATDAALETKYRAELEKRLAQERDSYAGSLRSLWLANGAVWACLLGFIIAQAFAIKKRSVELARLKAQREGK
ncbi:MAG: hypothetical protein KDB90_12865 [Planctomycetes bacterium]|nr:hypothetical protein [Planctomycetota bacterium]